MHNVIAWLGVHLMSLIPGFSSDGVGSGPVGSRQNTGRIGSLDFNYPRVWLGNGSDWLGSISGRGPHIGPELSSLAEVAKWGASGVWRRLARLARFLGSCSRILGSQRNGTSLGYLLALMNTQSSEQAKISSNLREMEFGVCVEGGEAETQCLLLGQLTAMQWVWPPALRECSWRESYETSVAGNAAGGSTAHEHPAA